MVDTGSAAILSKDVALASHQLTARRKYTAMMRITLPTKRYLYRADNSINPADNGITQCLS
jgi:hypothetical protein